MNSVTDRSPAATFLSSTVKRPFAWATAFALTFGPAFAGSSGLLAQPSEPPRLVRIVVPFAAGSITDNFARIVVPGLAERLGTNVVIDNRPGVNGVLGSELVAKSSPNGSTLLLAGMSAIVVNPWVYKSLPYDPVKGLLPVVRMGLLRWGLVVHPSVPVNTVAELIEYARKNPGKLAYASPNSNSLIAMEMLKRRAGVDILGVPYTSSPQAMLDLVSNRVQVYTVDFASANNHIRGGNARVLAVTMARRSSVLPEVPTVDETLKGFDVTPWIGLFAPGGTPSAVVNRIADASLAAIAVKEVQDKVAAAFDIAPLGSEAFGEYVRDQMAIWRKLVQETGIKPE